MIEREFVAQKTKEFYIRQYIEGKLKGAEISSVKLKKIPLGEKIIVATSRPGLVVGSKGANIKALTAYLKTHFKLENPRIEIEEIKNPFLDADVVASRIASNLERFGSSRFKGAGHKSIQNVLRAGALGIEIKISGKIPGARAKSWRFYQGYLKKCGDISVSGVRTAYASALLKTGVIGIQVRIMPNNIILPDHIEILEEPIQVEEVKDLEEEKAPAKGKATKKKATKKKTAKKKEQKTEAPKVEERTIEVKEGALVVEAEKAAEGPKVEESIEVKAEEAAVAESQKSEISGKLYKETSPTEKKAEEAKEE